MIARRLGDLHTVNDWYQATEAGLGLITIAQMQKAASAMGYTLNVWRDQNIASIKSALDNGKPVILLVNPIGLQHCGTTAPHFIVVVGYSKLVDVFYCHDPYFLNPGTGGPLTEQSTLAQAWSRCHEQGNPDWLMLTLEKGTPPITSTALLGVGMGNAGPLNSAEADALRTSRVAACKVLTVQDPGEAVVLINQVREANPSMFIMARLFFPPDSENQTKFSPQDFVNYVGVPAQTMYSMGVRYFEVHNEPNLYQEGCFWNWVNGFDFAQWLKETLRILRKMMPDAKFGYPGLSPQVGRYEGVWQDSDTFLVESTIAAQACDFIGVHSYWQADGTGHWQMRSEDFGGLYWRRVSARNLGRPLYITECSCNNGSTPYEDKARMYIEYMKLLSGIEAAMFFTLSWAYDPNREAWVGTPIPGMIGARP
jgi:hypothetical protein